MTEGKMAAGYTVAIQTKRIGILKHAAIAIARGEHQCDALTLFDELVTNVYVARRLPGEARIGGFQPE